MAPSWLTAVFVMLNEAWSARRSAQIRFLKLQVELLRQKAPGNRVILTPEDRQRLIRLGSQLRHRVDDLMGIVSVKRYWRWIREQQGGKHARRVGRRRVVPPSLRALIIRRANENTNRGVRRIVGELRKPALTPSRSTVRRVMIDDGLQPDPDRRAPKGVITPWRTFIDMHVNTMVACDFFRQNGVWTPLGRHLAYGLMFIHLGSRKVFVSPSTFEPNEQWTQQQARNLTLWLDDQGIDLRFLLHDRDTKFCESFDRVFKAAGVQVVRSPIQSPIANCYAESWIGTLKRECLNHFFCFSLRHLDYIVQTYVRYYNTLRPHQSRGNVPLGHADTPLSATPPPEDVGTVQRRALLGGLLNHYERKAA